MGRKSESVRKDDAHVSDGRQTRSLMEVMLLRVVLESHCPGAVRYSIHIVSSLVKSTYTWGPFLQQI